MDGLTHLDDSATLFVTEKDGTTHTTTAGEERRRFEEEFLRPRPCSTCGGSGWYQAADTPTGAPEWMRCPCGAGQDEPDDLPF